MRTKPPYGGARINRDHDLAKGLTALYLLNEGAGLARDLANPARKVTLTGATWSRSDAGLGLAATASVTQYGLLSTDPVGFAKPFTVILVAKLNSLSSTGGGGYSQSFLNFYKSGVGAVRIGNDEAAPGRIFASGTFFGGSGRQTNSGVLTLGKTHVIVVTNDATSVKIYCDGAQVDTGANANSTGTTNVLCARDTTVGAINGTVSLVATWDGRALTASEVRTLSANPYALLTAVRRSPDYWLAGGGATAFEGTATLGVGAAVTSNRSGSSNLQGSATLGVGALVEAARLGSATYPTGRIVTADAVRLVTAQTDIWSGNDDPAPAAGDTGDVFVKGAGGLFIKTAAGWVNYTPVWKRTGTLLEPLTAGDSLAVPGSLAVTGLGTFGTHVNPLTGYASNLGALTKKFLALHAAELWVETLVAQNTLATIGGRILVGPTNPLTVDLAAAGTTITVKYDNFASGDFVYLEANGNVEWMKVTSAAGGGAGAYTYSVERNKDGSGANDWVAGDAIFSTGNAAGKGYIDLYSTRSLRSASHLGPTIVGNVRTANTLYSDLSERWAIGNLDGLYGYSGANYGAAFGDPSNAWVKIDPTNGIRIGHNATTKIELTAAGVAKLIGIEAMSVILGSSGYIRQGQTAYDTGGAGFWLGDVSGTAKFSLGNSSGKKLLWDGTDFKLVNADLTLSTGTTWLGPNSLKWAVPSGFGGGTDDRFGLGSYAASAQRVLLMENLSYNATAGTNVDSYINIWTSGWRGTAALAAPLAFIILRSDGASNEGKVTIGPKLYVSGTIQTTSTIITGIQTYTISADQNNFSISADKQILKVTNTSGAVRYFNGFSSNGATPEDGRIITISLTNGSTSYIYLNHDNTGSTAAYRMYTRRQAALEIRQNESVTLRYDAADSRWISVG